MLAQRLLGSHINLEDQRLSREASANVNSETPLELVGVYGDVFGYGLEVVATAAGADLETVERYFGNPVPRFIRNLSPSNSNSAYPK